MSEERVAVNTPGVIQMLLMIETIRRADLLQEQQSQRGEASSRREAIVEVATAFAADMALCLDVWQKAGFASEPT